MLCRGLAAPVRAIWSTGRTSVAPATPVGSARSWMVPVARRFCWPPEVAHPPHRSFSAARQPPKQGEEAATDWKGNPTGKPSPRAPNKWLRLLGLVGAFGGVVGLTQLINWFKLKESNLHDSSASSNTADQKQPPIVFLDFAAGDRRLGRVFLELDGQRTPAAVENFRIFCTGELGDLSYRDSLIHAADSLGIHGGLLQVPGASEPLALSAYGEPFPDESFEIPHDRPYVLATEREQADSNTSRFVITTRSAPELDSSSVVFGRVVKGKDVVQRVLRHKRQRQREHAELLVQQAQRLATQSSSSGGGKGQAAAAAADPGLWDLVWGWARGEGQSSLVAELEHQLAEDQRLPATQEPVRVVDCGQLDLSGDTDLTSWDLDDPELPRVRPQTSKPVGAIFS